MEYTNAGRWAAKGFFNTANDGRTLAMGHGRLSTQTTTSGNTPGLLRVCEANECTRHGFYGSQELGVAEFRKHIIRIVCRYG